MGSKIIDLSKWQQGINWSKLAKDVKFIILRVQDGSYTDPKYNEYATQCKKHGIPFGVYAFCRYTTVANAKAEATNFYNRSRVNGHRPNFYFLDCEQQAQTGARANTEAYRAKLEELGVKKIGIYIAHHLRGNSTINFSKFDKVWIPRYGAKPRYDCDLWQYTDKGRVDGYSGGVDSNKIVKGNADWYLGKTTSVAPSKPTSPAKPSTPKASYYKKDKKEVVFKVDGSMYNSKTFNDKTKIGKVRKGDVFRNVKVVEYGDITRFQLSGGREIYITSNKEYIDATYYDSEDHVSKVELLKNQKAYADTEFKKPKGSFKKGQEFTVEKIVNSPSGTPRLYTKGKVYISANKALVKKIK